MSLQDVSDLLKLLNEVELTTVDERRLKQAFHEFYPISVSPIMLLNVRHQYVSGTNNAKTFALLVSSNEVN